MIDLNIREALQMNRPYVLVHMMASIDGRIDCGMTAQLAGEPE